MRRSEQRACAAARCLIAAIFLAATAGLGNATVGTGCLSYESAKTKLTGTLVRKIFPGPPEYQNISHGDRPETYWILVLSRPACVDADKERPDLNPAHDRIQTIQLVVSPEFYKKYKYLVGRRVIVTGTLFGEFTAHHRTPVLLTVESLAQAGKPGR